MMQLQELMSRAAKQAQLELQLPLLTDRCKELKETVFDLKTERDWAVLTAKNLEDPGFFQRLLGRVAEKQEKAQLEAREAAAAYEDAKRELDGLEHQLQQLQEAYGSFSGSIVQYMAARKAFLDDADAEMISRLGSKEIEAFRPVAIETVRKIRSSLHEARGWMQRDIRPRYSNPESRRMEYLHMADDYAQKLQELLVFFPQGSITLGASMSAPSSYISSVSMNLSQLDYLNIAIEQSLRVQKQLEEL